MGGNSGVAEKGIADTMMAGGNLPSFLSKPLRCLLRFLPEFPPPRSFHFHRDLAYVAYIRGEI